MAESIQFTLVPLTDADVRTPAARTGPAYDVEPYERIIAAMLADPKRAIGVTIPGGTLRQHRTRLAKVSRDQASGMPQQNLKVRWLRCEHNDTTNVNTLRLRAVEKRTRAKRGTANAASQNGPVTTTRQPAAPRQREAVPA